jgi:outer membrane protein OmpA-like peptidoglycan-associated protein
MFRPRLLLVFLGVLVSAPAAAQIVGRPFELSGHAGWMHYDTRAYRSDAPLYGLGATYRLSPGLAAEGYALFGPAEQDTFPFGKDNFTTIGGGLRFALRPAFQRVVPFATVGMGWAQSHTTGHPPDQLARGSGSLGLGVLASLRGDPRTYMRLDVRSLWFKERDAFEFSNHYAITLGLTRVLGGKSNDTDLDGVRDWLDRCPNTPVGARVDANGCPTDADRDSVFDGIDKCENTPQGCVIDATGCPKDADQDGVCDGLDQCADTPAGQEVDTKGCPTDIDGDGVPLSRDNCPDTPKGCTVDANGCPTDSDKDGVCDGQDQCPNTPEGLQVDVNGCPIEVSEREIELLDTGMIRLQNINFETGKAVIKPESFPVLAEVARILQQYPTLRIEIGGHTDSRGSAALNARLSDQRAAAVLEHMRQSFPQISPDRFTSKGYGPERPIAPNSTELGRARNRRVEFKVLNTDVLRTEREKRRFLRRDESTAPRDTLPSPVPVDTLRTPAQPDTTSRR